MADEKRYACHTSYFSRRVLFAVQLQDRGEHRARFVTAFETFENVVITLFDFEQGTDENYYDHITSYFYSVWIPYFEPRSTGRSLSRRRGWTPPGSSPWGRGARTRRRRSSSTGCEAARSPALRARGLSKETNAIMN